MVRLIVGWLFALLVGCGPANIIKECRDNPDFKAGGVIVCFESIPVDPAQVERHVEVVEEVSAIYFPKVSDFEKKLKARETTAVFLDDPLSVGCEHVGYSIYRCDNHIGGANADSRYIFIKSTSKQEECLATTSLAHELLHSVEGIYLGGSTRNHTTEYMFRIGNPDKDPSETIEGQVTIKLWREWCQ